MLSSRATRVPALPILKTAVLSALFTEDAYVLLVLLRPCGFYSPRTASPASDGVSYPADVLFLAWVAQCRPVIVSVQVRTVGSLETPRPFLFAMLAIAWVSHFYAL